MRVCGRCLWLILVVPLALAGIAKGGDGIWLDTSGNPLTESPKIIANWGIFEAEAGAEYDSWEADFSVNTTTTIGYLLCTANSRPTYANSDGSYSWSKSMNWDSVGLLFTHIKRVYDFISDPKGVLMGTATCPYQTQKQMDDLLVAGPTNQRVSVGLEDLPYIPDWVDVHIGTNFLFDVNIEGGYTVDLDQSATIENLTIQSGSTLAASFGYQLNLNKAFSNYGEFYGTIHRIKGEVLNTGMFNGSPGEVNGPATNTGTMTLTDGTLHEGLTNNGWVTVAAHHDVTIEKELTGSGTFLNEGGLTLSHEQDPDVPFQLDQEIVSTAYLSLPHGYIGAPIEAAGSVVGKIGGTINVRAGQSLQLSGQVWSGGLVQAAGEGTRLFIATGGSELLPVEQQEHNRGRISVTDGAELRTLTYPFTNDGNGIIELTDSTFTLEMPYYSGMSYGRSSRLTNNGIIRLNNSLMKFIYSNHSYTWWHKHIDGNGTVELTSGSVLENPYIIGGEQRVVVDPTSTVFVGGVTAAYASPCRIEGVVENQGAITSRDYFTLAGSLQNDGTITVEQNKLTLDVPQVSGTGSITVEDGAQLFLKNTAHQGQPVVLAQPITVNGGHLDGGEDGFVTQQEGVVRITGQLGGRVGGHVQQLPGEYLLLSGTVTPTGLVESNGADKLLRWEGGINDGRFEVTNGATIRTGSFEHYNNGSINVSAGSVMECRQDTTGLGYSQTLWNQGQLHFDASTLRFVWRTMNYNWFTHHIEGSGRIELTNGSVLENPDIRGEQQVILDETSSLVTTFSEPGRFYLPDVETHGQVTLAAGTSMEIGSWNLADGSFSTPWARLYFSGNWTIGLSDPSDFGVGTLEVTFTGGDADDPLFLTAAGRDLGNDSAAWENNFALSVLTVAADGYLVLAHRDGDLEAGETLGSPGNGDALYVESLVLEPGAILNLNGASIYYRSLSGSPDQIINEPVPEPSCLFLLAGGGLVVLYRRRHTASRTRN